MDQGSIDHNCAEIKASDLGQTDSNTIREKVFRGLLAITDEATINTIQVIPERWPQKVVIEMNNQQNKEKIINLGISVNNKHIEIREKGQKYVRVNIFDAPLDMSDETLMDYLEQYGMVVEMQRKFMFTRENEKNRKTNIKTGERNALMMNMSGVEIPPFADIPYADETAKVKFWHFGQLLKQCRKCKQIVDLENHECEITCHNCGEKGHMIRECDKGRKCRVCQQFGHEQRECKRLNKPQDVNSNDTDKNNSRNISDQANIISNITTSMDQLHSAIQMADTPAINAIITQELQSTKDKGFQKPKRNAKTVKEIQTESLSDQNMYSLLENLNPEDELQDENGKQQNVTPQSEVDLTETSTSEKKTKRERNKKRKKEKCSPSTGSTTSPLLKFRKVSIGEQNNTDSSGDEDSTGEYDSATEEGDDTMVATDSETENEGLTGNNSKPQEKKKKVVILTGKEYTNITVPLSETTTLTKQMIQNKDASADNFKIDMENIIPLKEHDEQTTVLYSLSGIGEENEYSVEQAEIYQMINEIHDTFKNAIIVITGIPPKNEDLNSDYNRKIKLINDHLQDQLKTEIRTIFVDCTDLFIENGHVIDKMFELNEPTKPSDQGADKLALTWKNIIENSESMLGRRRKEIQSTAVGEESDESEM